MKKRILSLLLAICMAATLLPVTALAADGGLANAESWTTDRREPKDFSITDGTISMTVNENGDSTGFYRWQGMSAATGVGASDFWSVEYTLDITESMLNAGSANASMWIDVRDETDSNVDWSIIYCKREDGKTVFQAWDSEYKDEDGENVGQFYDITSPEATQGKHVLKTIFYKGMIYQYIDGVYVNNYSVGKNATAPARLHVEVANGGKEYTVNMSVPTVSTEKSDMVLYVDNGAELAAAVQAADADDVIKLTDDITLSENITISKDVTIVGDGADKTNIVAYEGQTVQNDSRIKITNGAQVKFEDLTFTASYAADIVAPVLGVCDTSKLELNRCTITDTSDGHTSAYGLINTGSAVEGSKVTMKNCTVNSVLGTTSGPTYYVLGQGGVCELDIQDNVFNLGSWFMFNIQASGLIKNNQFNGVEGASGRAVNANESKGLVVEKNTLDDSLYGTRFVIGGDFTIKDNTFEALGDDLAIAVYNKPDTTSEISGNTFAMEDGSYGIRVTNLWGGVAGDLSSLNISNNTFNGTGVYHFRNDTWSGTADLSTNAAENDFVAWADCETQIKLPTAVSRSGYAFQGWSDGTKTYNAGDVVTLKPADETTEKAAFEAQWSVISSGGGSSSSGNKTETVTNPDGSVTTTVTKPDGSTTETTKQPDGTTTTVVTDKNGNSETTVSLSSKAITEAKDEAVALPMDPVEVTDDQKEAPVITVRLGNGGSALVEIPADDVTAGTVAVLVNSDGTEEIVMDSVVTEDGVALTVKSGAKVKIVDNSIDFIDVPDTYWGADEIDFVTSRELFNGTSANKFSPENTMTRAMIVTVLARYEGVDTTTGDEWYEAGAAWAVKEGISDGTNLMDAITREQLVTMLYRYAGEPEVTGTVTGFPDAASVSDWAENAMVWALENDLINGMTDGTLKPQGTATRAQVAAILARFVANVG